MKHERLRQLAEAIYFTGHVHTDASALLTHYGRADTAEHSRRVATEAVRLAGRFHINQTLAEVAGVLHDISRVFANEEQLAVAHELGIDVLPEEHRVPMLLHQKVSVVKFAWN